MTTKSDTHNQTIEVDAPLLGNENYQTDDVPILQHTADQTAVQPPIQPLKEQHKSTSHAPEHHYPRSE